MTVLIGALCVQETRHAARRIHENSPAAPRPFRLFNQTPIASDARVSMREVFIHQDSAKVGLYKSILDAAEIPNFVRNGLANNSVTDMPSPVFFPALCVLNDEDYDKAL